MCQARMTRFCFCLFVCPGCFLCVFLFGVVFLFFFFSLCRPSLLCLCVLVFAFRCVLPACVHACPLVHQAPDLCGIWEGPAWPFVLVCRLRQDQQILNQGIGTKTMYQASVLAQRI